LIVEKNEEEKFFPIFFSDHLSMKEKYIYFIKTIITAAIFYIQHLKHEI